MIHKKAFLDFLIDQFLNNLDKILYYNVMKKFKYIIFVKRHSYVKLKYFFYVLIVPISTVFTFCFDLFQNL